MRTRTEGGKIGSARGKRRRRRRQVECLTNTMQKHYREQGVAASEEGKAAFAEQLKTKLPAGAELTEDMLTGAFGMQLVESVPLLSGGPHTGWIHVNMYCDDKCVHRAACRGWRAEAQAWG